MKSAFSLAGLEGRETVQEPTQGIRMQMTLEDMWQRAVDFHGHACPGLAIGCRMVFEAAKYLDIARSAADEEIVCVTESDACCVDAAQAILSCTLGKGNLLLKLRGKAAMSFYNRSSGKGCRVVWNGTGDDSLPKADKISLILSLEGGSLFAVQALESSPPGEALLSKSVSCKRCGERTSEAMMRPYKGALYCLDCWPNHGRILD